MDHSPVPVRTAVQPSLAGQGRPGRNAFSMHFPNESILTEKKRQGKSSFPLALQTVKKHLGGVGGAAAPLTFIRIRRLCRRGGLLILPAKSIPYKFGRPLVGRICFLAKVVKTTFVTRGSARGKAAFLWRFCIRSRTIFSQGWAWPRNFCLFQAP